MARVRSVLLIGAAAWLAACAEMAGPPPPQTPLVRADGQLHQLRWRPTSAPRVFAVVPSTLTQAAGHRAAAGQGGAPFDHHR